MTVDMAAIVVVMAATMIAMAEEATATAGVSRGILVIDGSSEILESHANHDHCQLSRLSLLLWGICRILHLSK